VENLHKLQQVGDLFASSWSELLTLGILDYVDLREEESTFVKPAVQDLSKQEYTQWDPKWEYMEIHDTSCIGIATSNLPYGNHNPPSKNTHQSIMMKQFISGDLGIHHDMSVLTGSMHLWHNERPLVSTEWQRRLGLYRVAIGMNVTVCVTCYTGETMEDGIGGRKGALEAGMWRNSVSRTSSVRERKAIICSNKKEVLNERKEYMDFSWEEKGEERHVKVHHGWTPIVPPPQSGNGEAQEQLGIYNLKESNKQRTDDFSSIEDPDGIVCPGIKSLCGTIVAQKSAILPPSQRTHITNGKTSQRVQIKYAERSVAQKRSGTGRFSRVMMTQDANGDRLVRIKVMRHAPPMIGDKFNSRHGQKGVMGSIYLDSDMMFDEETGLIPDVTIDTVGFLARLTRGQPIEGVVTNLCALLGIPDQDGTMWSKTDLDMIRIELERRGVICDDKFDTSMLNQTLSLILEIMGLKSQGTRTMIDGVSGNTMECELYVNECYYGPLKQKVSDKFRARATGKRDPVTLQPAHKLKDNGGLKFGEMEINATKSHGAVASVQGRTYLHADRVTRHLCYQCHSWIFARNGQTFCSTCQKEGTGTRHMIPNGMKLCIEEMNMCGIATECVPELIGS
jgi:DNA-directed RNA polymerase beta subunit